MLAAAVVVYRQLLEDGDPAGKIIVSELPSSLSWAAIELAASAADAIHAAIDPRSGDRQAKAVRLSYGERAAEFVWTPYPADGATRGYRTTHSAYRIADDRLLAAAERLRVDCPRKVRDFAVRQVERFSRKVGDSPRDHRPAALLHTSGSVADPKAVLLSHDNLLSNALGKLDAMPQSASDVRLNVLPFSHAYARTCELGTWAVTGGALACLPQGAALADAAAALRPTLINATPLVWDRVRADISTAAGGTGLLGGRLRRIASGGAGLSEDTFAAFEAVGLPLYQGYGLTETSPVICSNRVGEPVENDIGRPIADVEIRIDPDRQLWVAGPNVMLGYWAGGELDRAATEAKLQSGYLATGDLAELDRRGRLRIIGRIDDRISLPSGYKVDPAETERRIRAIDWVTDAIVLLRESTLICLISIRGPSVGPETRSAAVRDAVGELPRYGRPSQFYFAASLPAEILECRGPKGGWRRGEVAGAFERTQDRFDRVVLPR